MLAVEMVSEGGLQGIEESLGLSLAEREGVVEPGQDLLDGEERLRGEHVGSLGNVDVAKPPQKSCALMNEGK